MMHSSDIFMHRCIQLALLGGGYVVPNPMVGAVLVCNNKIIGEGYHMQYGHAHAEVNCINSVAPANRHLISSATLYVSLEPCAHYGKTPPCANFILEYKIPNVIIGCTDSFSAVNGKGIALLKNAGVNVTVGVLENECIELNKRFFKFNNKKRPYVVLKWAQTSNGFISDHQSERLLISNQTTNRLVHKWRSEEMAIMVGSNTIIKDNPQLNNRLWNGRQPIRLILDRTLKIRKEANILDGTQPTVVFNNSLQMVEGNITYCKLLGLKTVVEQIMEYCCQNSIQSILVEGGTTILQLFIDNGIWDEARVIVNKDLIVENGLRAPVLKNQKLRCQEHYFADCISYYIPENE